MTYVNYENKPGHDTLCFTGHRPNKLCGYDYEKYKPFVKQMTEILNQYYDKGFRRFISGGAQGFDQLAFWAVHNLKKEHPDVKNIIYVPFKGQDSIWPSEGCFSKHDYSLMLKCADEIKYLLDVKPESKDGITKALLQRNHTMVNYSDLVLALQNDTNWKKSRFGGTAECMKYADKCDKPVHRITCDTQPQLLVTNIYTN